MKNENYYVGLDIGTDSVGYAVSDEKYNLCKYKGEPMWGTTIFDEANLAAERRVFRSARRRLDRRQQRVSLVMELFALDIAKIDEGFFKRIKESYMYPENEGDKVRLFDSYNEQKEYNVKYPTIHHLIDDLIKNTEPHDVRLVCIACSWLVAHRGHFLSEVDKHNIDEVKNFKEIFQKLSDFLKRDEVYSLPWRENIDCSCVELALKKKLGVTKKTKLLAEALFDGGKPPKIINEEYKYNYDSVVKLLCGGKDSLEKVFGKEEYKDLEDKSIALNMDDEKFAAVLSSVDEEDAEFITILKMVYDWSVLVDILNGKETISEAKVCIYEQHKKDLVFLKALIKKYAPDKYYDVFRSSALSSNYVAYSYNTKSCKNPKSVKKCKNKDDFYRYIQSIVKNFSVDESDSEKYADMIARIESGSFMPKQVNGDNRVIPYQLYWYELNKILENAKKYIPFLGKADVDGITGAEKILSVFEFRVPYYVGPLVNRAQEKNSSKMNHWMVRKAEGKIYPWNFNDKVDLDASEEAFIARMTNTCTYLPGEDVLPKNSLVYSAFEVLNEINNIKINGIDIDVLLKQNIYNDVFMKYANVSLKRIKEYLISNNYMNESDNLSGIDINVKSSLAPFIRFRKLINSGDLKYADVERIINRAAYSEDKVRFKKWLKREFNWMPENDITYISGLKLKGFGRLSRKLLCGIEGAEKNTGEVLSIIRAMWETNCNLMQILSDKFTFAEKIEKITKEYYDQNPKSLLDRMDEMRISNAVKRPIIRTFDILKDIVKVQGRSPEMIFIEMARGANEDEKGNRTSSRFDQIRALYDKVDNEYIPILCQELDGLGDDANNKLQSDKLFLYFMQFGQCLYTGKRINIESVLSGDGTFNIDHIYPRCYVKDDSIINNLVLVDSKANADKGDGKVRPEVQKNMVNLWQYLNKNNLISDEKYRRLTRTTDFTADEKYEFINRQLVETRQSTKAVAALLKEQYPESEIVYVKAGIVSDFRKEFGLLKSRTINDLHHAKDAYLNIATGNVWYSKFNCKFYRADAINNLKTEVLFTHPVKRNGKLVWSGVSDKDHVIKIACKNTAHMTKYSFCKKGGLFDQMPVSTGAGLVPRKKNMPADIYGGYNKTTASFFVIVRYKADKKQDVVIMPVEFLYAKEFLNNESFSVEYTKKTIYSITNKSVTDVEFPMNRRIIKINTMISLDGLMVCITGKSTGGRQMGVSVMSPFITNIENEMYIKKLESFENKKKKNANIVYSEKHSGISAEKNIDLYDYYISKFQSEPYIHRPANPVGTLIKGRLKFETLLPLEQISILLKIQGLFGRGIKADLKMIGGAESTGAALLSSSLSNWKKNYKDVRIIDQSASGIFTSKSDNLLDLL